LPAKVLFKFFSQEPSEHYFNSKYNLQDYLEWKYDYDYGNCYVINSDARMSQSDSGLNHGLFMVLFAGTNQNQASNMLNFDYSYGLRILIDNHLYLPLFNENKISIKTGTCTKFLFCIFLKSFQI
jgi:hypothetical protein